MYNDRKIRESLREQPVVEFLKFEKPTFTPDTPLDVKEVIEDTIEKLNEHIELDKQITKLEEKFAKAKPMKKKKPKRKPVKRKTSYKLKAVK